MLFLISIYKTHEQKFMIFLVDSYQLNIKTAGFIKNVFIDI